MSWLSSQRVFLLFFQALLGSLDHFPSLKMLFPAIQSDLAQKPMENYLLLTKPFHLNHCFHTYYKESCQKNNNLLLSIFNQSFPARLLCSEPNSYCSLSKSSMTFDLKPIFKSAQSPQDEEFL